MRPLEAEDRWIGRLLLGDVFACCFAQGGGGLFDVENVISDLKSPADGFAEVAEAGYVRIRCASANGACTDGGANERGGFAAMNVFEGFRAGVFAFGFQIGDLAADHTVDGAGGSCDFGENLHAKIGLDRSR